MLTATVIQHLTLFTSGWTFCGEFAINRLFANAFTCVLIGLSSLVATAQNPGGKQWIGTWATAPQPPEPGNVKTFQNQTLRLIVHISAGGTRVRIKISNTFGDQTLVIGGAHIARRTEVADIDPKSDRILKFEGKSSITVVAGATVVSDPVELEVPALSDLAVSLFLPESTEVKTLHVLALQTSYVSRTGNATGKAKFPTAEKIHTWPFLTGVDVEAPARGAAIVAFGSSLTDGDGTESDSNGRWPDVLAQQLQKSSGGKAELGVLNEGIIGNRLLHDSPAEAAGGRFGSVLGQAGLRRFDRDVLAQSGVKYVIVGLGINDIAMPGSLTPATEDIKAESVIAGYRQLISRAHQKGIRIIGTTNPPFENSFLDLGPPGNPITFYTPDKESMRQKVNTWILSSGEFDGVVDLDAVVRDPSHPTQLRPKYDSGDHLHPNNAGCRAEGNAIPLAFFQSHQIGLNACGTSARLTLHGVNGQLQCTAPASTLKLGFPMYRRFLLALSPLVWSINRPMHSQEQQKLRRLYRSNRCADFGIVGEQGKRPHSNTCTVSRDCCKSIGRVCARGVATVESERDTDARHTREFISSAKLLYLRLP